MNCVNKSENISISQKPVLFGSIAIARAHRKNVKEAIPIKMETAVKAKDFKFINFPPVKLVASDKQQ